MLDFDFDTLRRIGLTEYQLQHIAAQPQQHEPEHDDAQLMRVTEIGRDWLTVHDGHDGRRARALPRLLHTLDQEGSGLTVGDWVGVRRNAHGEYWIGVHLAPLNHIARRGNDGRRHRLVSNIDTALLVMGLDHDFNLRRMERYLALVETAGVAPVVVMSKADIGIEVERRMDQLRQRLPHGVPTLALNTLQADAALALAPWLNGGQTLVLLGTSGAGKSSLTNTLCGAAQATGGVRQGDGRGRHTTTSRTLHLCESGACIIDTPGLRSWQPDADQQTLAAGFADVAALAERCQFRDCRHDAEPGCAVRTAVDPDRLLNYHKLLREARRGQETPLERIDARAKWKVILKASQVRAKDKWR